MRVLFVYAATGERTISNFSRELRSDLTVFNPQEDMEQPDIEQFDGVIISGSSASVLDDDEWVETVEKLVRDAHGEVPLLGICWGHQIIAQALGGVVDKRRYREIGYTSVRTLFEDPLVEGFSNPQVVFETHEDQVMELPDGAERLVENYEGIQGFKIGDATYGVQFHPEYEEQDMRNIINKYLDGIWRRDELSKLTNSMYKRFIGSKRILSNFEQVMEEQSA